MVEESEVFRPKIGIVQKRYSTVIAARLSSQNLLGPNAPSLYGILLLWHGSYTEYRTFYDVDSSSFYQHYYTEAHAPTGSERDHPKWGAGLDLAPLLVVAGFDEVKPDVSPWSAHLVVVVGPKVVLFTRH